MTAPIVTAFADDHRTITRGFHRILEALDAGDMTAAATFADELDRDGGAHIAFEEQVLYPQVAQCRGQEYARNLYKEHAIALDALSKLMSDEELDDEALAGVRAGIKIGLDHAISCGTLASVLADQPPDTHESMMAKMNELRTLRPRWSGLRRSG